MHKYSSNRSTKVQHQHQYKEESNALKHKVKVLIKCRVNDELNSVEYECGDEYIIK